MDKVKATDKPIDINNRLRKSLAVMEKMNFLVIALGLLLIIMTFYSDRFLTQRNIFTVMRAASVYIIIGVGKAFLMTSRNIDLSVGSMLGLIMALAGTYIFNGGSVGIAILFALGLGICFGIFNGTLVTRLGVPALLATLGMLVSYRGIVNQYMYGTTVSRFPDSLKYLGQGFIGPVPVPVIISLVVAVLGALLYHFTIFGRYAIAIGDNEEAAILAGINTKKWKTIFFAFQGLLVGLAAIIYLGRLDAAHPSIGTGMELHIIAGVALGGTSLFGGKGTMWGVVLGMYVISVLENGLMLAGAGFFVQNIVLGFLLVGSVAIQSASSKDKKTN